MNLGPLRIPFASAIALLPLALALSASGAPAAPAPAATAAPASGGMRIAVANPARIFNDMQETKALQAKMQEEQAAFINAQKQKLAELDAAKKRREDTNPNSPQYAELNDQLATLSIQYKVWAETQQAMAQSNQKRQMRTLFKKIEDAVAEIAKRDGIDLVIADQRDPLPEDLDAVDVRTLRNLILQRDVLYSSDRTDLSQAVLLLLDARFKAAPAAASTGNK